MIAPETQQFMAQRAGSHIREIYVDHSPLASATDQVVAIIAEAVAPVAEEAVRDPQTSGSRA